MSKAPITPFDRLVSRAQAAHADLVAETDPGDHYVLHWCHVPTHVPVKWMAVALSMLARQLKPEERGHGFVFVSPSIHDDIAITYRIPRKPTKHDATYILDMIRWIASYMERDADVIAEVERVADKLERSSTTIMAASGFNYIDLPMQLPMMIDTTMNAMINLMYQYGSVDKAIEAARAKCLIKF